MKTQWLALSILVLATIILFFTYGAGLIIQGPQLWFSVAMIVFGFIVLIGWMFWHRMPAMGQPKDSKWALEYLKKWFTEMFREELQIYNSMCTARYFGIQKPILHFGFIVERKGSRKDFTAIVSTEPPSIVKWNDNPSVQEKIDPFIDFSPTMLGSPVPEAFEPKATSVMSPKPAIVQHIHHEIEKVEEIEKLKGKEKEKK